MRQPPTPGQPRSSIIQYVHSDIRSRRVASDWDERRAIYWDNHQEAITVHANKLPARCVCCCSATKPQVPAGSQRDKPIHAYPVLVPSGLPAWG